MKCNVWFNAFHLQGSQSWFGLPLTCGLLCCGGIYGNIVSQPLLPTLIWSSSHLTDVTVSLCQFLGFCFVLFSCRENFSIYSCRFLESVGGTEVKIFLVILLN